MELKKLAHIRRESFWKYYPLVCYNSLETELRWVKVSKRLCRYGGLPCISNILGIQEWADRTDDLPTRVSETFGGKIMVWYNGPGIGRKHNRPAFVHNKGWSAWYENGELIRKVWHELL